MHQSSRQAVSDAFTRTDLLAVIAVITVFAGLCLPAFGRTRQTSQSATDLSNVRQIMAAMNMYCAENSDYVPHPTWGTALTGVDGWAYATRNNGRDPNLPSTATANAIADCAGRDIDSVEYTNQLAFFRIGQISPFLQGNQRVLECPKDVAERNQGRNRTQWLGRPVKVTSYAWNGAVCGFPSGRQPRGDRTYKLHQFLGRDILLWETNEANWFFFNDAAFNATSLGETISRRHGMRDTSSFVNFSGVALIGHFGGNAEFMQLGLLNQLARTGGPGRRNEMMCGPGF